MFSRRPSVLDKVLEKVSSHRLIKLMNRYSWLINKEGVESCLKNLSLLIYTPPEFTYWQKLSGVYNINIPLPNGVV